MRGRHRQPRPLGDLAERQLVAALERVGDREELLGDPAVVVTAGHAMDGVWELRGEERTRRAFDRVEYAPSLTNVVHGSGDWRPSPQSTQSMKSSLARCRRQGSPTGRASPSVRSGTSLRSELSTVTRMDFGGRRGCITTRVGR